MGLRRRLGRIAPWWRRFKRNGYRCDRCDLCGHGFHWSRDARHSFGNRDGKHWHQWCIAYLTWRAKADDRLTIVGVMADLSGLTSRDVTAAMEFRADDHDERVTASNRAFRVFYDLKRATAEPTNPDPQPTTEDA